MKAEVKGADQMRQLLQSFPRRIQRDVINSVAARGATVVKKHAKKNIKQNGSVKSGTLLKSVKTRKKKKTNGIYYIYTSRDAWYSHFIERGTSKMSANPFMRPAIDENQAEVLREMGIRMAKRMAKESEKMTAKYKTMSKSYRKKLA